MGCSSKYSSQHWSLSSLCSCLVFGSSTASAWVSSEARKSLALAAMKWRESGFSRSFTWDHSLHLCVFNLYSFVCLFPRKQNSSWKIRIALLEISNTLVVLGGKWLYASPWKVFESRKLQYMYVQHSEIFHSIASFHSLLTLTDFFAVEPWFLIIECSYGCNHNMIVHWFLLNHS